MTGSGENGLNKSIKVPKLGKKVKVGNNVSLVTRSQFSKMSHQSSVSLYKGLVPECHATFWRGRRHIV